MAEEQRDHVAVVGGGVIGMSVAWRLASAGSRVTLIDPHPAGATSCVAGGMLAPVAEARPGEEPLLELGSASLRRWPEFAASVGSASGRDHGLSEHGTLVVGSDSADREELDALAEHLSGLGRTVTRHSARALRKLEPALGPDIRGGLDVPGDLSVDNRRFLAALRGAAEAAGTRFLAARASRVEPGRVEIEDSSVACDLVVVAAGAHSAELHPALTGRLRPVKGEVLRLRARSTALPPPRRTIRGPVHGRQVYLVPRTDGMVVGATQYEAGFDTEVTLGGVRDLIADAERFVPAVAEYELAETAAGLRPATPDNLPLLGRLDEGVLVATGHHRNGFLLAPITAETVAAMVHGTQPPPEAATADPARFAAARLGGHR